MFKIGDKVKYDGSSFAANTVLIPGYAYSIVSIVNEGYERLILEGYNSIECYLFAADMFSLVAPEIDYLAITREFG